MCLQKYELLSPFAMLSIPTHQPALVNDGLGCEKMQALQNE